MMSLFNKAALLAAIVCVAIALSTPSMAQSSQDMELLTDAERHTFFLRLQKTISSAERAKLTAEMNRIVQERRLDLRTQAKSKESK